MSNITLSKDRKARQFKYVGDKKALSFGGIIIKQGDVYTVDETNSFMLRKLEGRPDVMEVKEETKKETKEDETPSPAKNVTKRS